MSGYLDYIADSKTVSTSASVTLELEELLGGKANIGWITVDTGTVYVQINGNAKQKVTLTAGDVMNFKEEEKWKLQRIIITAAAATVRYFFKKVE